MYGESGHTVATLATRQLLREQDVGELRPAVRLVDRIVLLALQVVPSHVFGKAMPDRRHAYDARRRASAQPVKQQIRQQEVTEMVGAERHLKAIGCDPPLAEIDTRIVDEHVQRIPPAEHVCCALAYRRKGCKVEHDTMHVAASGPRAQLGHCRVYFSHVT